MMNDREREAQEFREKFFGNIRKINKVLEEREQEEKSNGGATTESFNEYEYKRWIRDKMIKRI